MLMLISVYEVCVMYIILSYTVCFNFIYLVLQYCPYLDVYRDSTVLLFLAPNKLLNCFLFVYILSLDNLSCMMSMNRIIGF